MRPEPFVVADGQHEGRARQVSDEDFEVLRIGESVLREAAEEVMRVLDDVLIERCAGGQYHRR